MERKNRIIEMAAWIVIGISIQIVGILLIVLGLTFLPVVGIFAGVTLIGQSIYFFNPPTTEVKNEKGQIARLAYEDDQQQSSWPPLRKAA